MGPAAEAKMDAVGYIHRYVERYDNYETTLDYGCFALVAKLGKNFF